MAAGRCPDVDDAADNVFLDRAKGRLGTICTHEGGFVGISALQAKLPALDELREHKAATILQGASLISRGCVAKTRQAARDAVAWDVC